MIRKITATCLLIAFCQTSIFLISGCSDDEEQVVEPPKPDPWGAIKVQISKKSTPDLSGLKESKEKYKSRYEAIIKGSAEGNLAANAKVADDYCRGQDWSGYAEKNKLPDSYSDLMSYVRNCQVGAFLAISFGANINEKYKRDSAVHLLNILTDDIGVGKVSLSNAITGREDYFQRINPTILQIVYNINVEK